MNDLSVFNEEPLCVSTNKVSSLDTVEGKIKTGQGEYIVFHSLPNGEKKEVARDIYEQVYKILNDHAPAVMKECDNRYETIKSKIQVIDPTLEVVFVPRTLYELIFIRKCIEEDLEQKSICPQLSSYSYKIKLDDFEGDQQKFQAFQESRKELLAKRKCWHLCYFTDVGDNNHPGVRDVAYRLNNVAAELLLPAAGGLTYEELSDHAEKEISFLRKHHKKCQEEMNRAGKGIKVDSICSCSTPGPTSNFGYESYRGYMKPMGIRNDEDAKIIRDAMAIECSELAQRAFILYRGANFENDSVVISWEDKDTPYSLSFGSSLFAGSLFDAGATAFHYMRNEKNAYAIPVPFDQLNSSPFFIPPTNTLSQLFGDGEVFHGRTKAWKDHDVMKIAGMNCGENGHMRDHLKSELTKDELISQFQNYKKQAIQLK